METAAGNIERLPEELLAAVISLTSSPDACRAAAVSRTSRAAADSDAVWSHLLPGDLPEFDQGKLACKQPSKKALFRRLSDKPAILTCGLLCMQLDKVTGDKYYMFRKPEKLDGEEEDCKDGYDDKEEDETPDQSAWIDLGCSDIERSKRFESFQSAFLTS